MKNPQKSNNLEDFCKSIDEYTRTKKHSQKTILICQLCEENIEDAMEYMAEKFSKKFINDFGSLNKYIYLPLHDVTTPLDVKKEFKDIDRLFADYSNSYQGIIAISLSTISQFINQEHFRYLVEGLKDHVNKATIILIKSRILNLEQERLTDKIRDHFNETYLKDNAKIELRDLSKEKEKEIICLEEHLVARKKSKSI